MPKNNKQNDVGSTKNSIPDFYLGMQPGECHCLSTLPSCWWDHQNLHRMFFFCLRYKNGIIKYFWQIAWYVQLVGCGTEPTVITFHQGNRGHGGRAKIGVLWWELIFWFYRTRKRRYDIATKIPTCNQHCNFSWNSITEFIRFGGFVYVLLFLIAKLRLRSSFCFCPLPQGQTNRVPWYPRGSIKGH